MFSSITFQKFHGLSDLIYYKSYSVA
jgi:hypothetical protein